MEFPADILALRTNLHLIAAYLLSLLGIHIINRLCLPTVAWLRPLALSCPAESVPI